ncbi:hypothetical protein BKA80DRAFT_322020 [Phyllosticta citrichinensis]
MSAPNEAQEPFLADGKSRIEHRKPWVPPMLRKSRAIVLALYCWLLAASLQAMDLVFKQNGGIPVEHSHKYSIWAATYLPIAGVVILSFLWKPVISDLKRITPWASLSKEWTKASRSVLLDYTTEMEFLSVFRAAHYRHDALFMALLVGFLCGVLSPLANSLTYVDPLASHQVSTHFFINSTFDFNGTLANPNGTIAYSPSHLSTAPYGSVAFSRLQGGYSTPWTTDSYVFESFSPESSGLDVDTFMTAEVQSFSTQFACTWLDYIEVNDGEEYYLPISSGDGTMPDCNQTVPGSFSLHPFEGAYRINTTRAWLNISSCSHTDTGVLTATVANISYEADDPATNKTMFTVEPLAALACAVGFHQQRAEITVNGSTGNVERLALLGEPMEMEPILTTVQLWMYLNEIYFPGLSDIMGFFLEVIPGLSGAQFRVTEIMTKSVMDPFFGLLTAGDSAILKSYGHDRERFQSDVETLGAQIMAQIVNSQARNQTSDPILGTVQATGPRLLLHRGFLRALQSALIVIGCIAVLVATLLRPACLLFDDPGRLAAGALTLSNSTPRIHDACAQEGIASTKTMQHNFGPLDWKLISPSEEKRGFSCQQRINQIGCSAQGTAAASENSGWQPLILRLGLEVICSMLLAGVIATLLAFLLWSQRNDGLIRDDPFLQSVFRSTSTTILVVIGYICSGIGAAVEEVAPYRILLQRPNKNQQSANNNARSSRIPPLPVNNWIGFSQATSTSAVFLIPLIKILAAGLYGLQSTTASYQVQPFVDTSLVSHFEFVKDFLDSQSNRIVDLHARQFVEWTQYPSFSIDSRPGALSNLIFSNLTDTGLDSASNSTTAELKLRVPAISINVSISTVDDVWFFTGTAKYLGTADRECLLIDGPNYDMDSSDWKCWGSIGFTVGPNPNCTVDQYKYNGHFIRESGGFCAYLADMSTLSQPIANTTPINLDDQIFPQSLNASIPPFMKIKGSVELTRVLVDVIYSRDSGNTWTPKSFDALTIKADEPYFNSQKLPVTSNGFVPVFETESVSALYDASLWPSQEESDSFFQWLAVYAEYQLHNLTAILDQDEWIETIKTLLIAYNVELLTEYRHFASANATAEGVEPQSFDGTLRYYEARIYQDKPTTIVLVVLLGTMLCCYLWTFFRYPNRAILPKSPGSIAAQLSLLAHSELVRRLQENGVTRLTDEEIWEKAALGWWRKVEPKDAEINSGENTDADSRQKVPPLRWGIDIGEPIARRSWDDPPDMEELQDETPTHKDQSPSDAGSFFPGAQSDDMELQSLQSRRESAGKGDQVILDQRSPLDHQCSEDEGTALEDPPSRRHASLDERLSMELEDQETEDSGVEYRRCSEEQRPIDSASELLLRRETV